MADIRPPHVRFEVREAEDREATIKNGFYSIREVDFIILIPHGSEGKSQIEEVYSDWLRKIKRVSAGAIYAMGADRDMAPVMESRFPQEWLTKIEEGYKAWKDGREIPLEGFSILNWPLIGPSLQRVIHSKHVLTVEALAACDDETCASFGMGGINLRQKARDWLEARNGDAAKLAQKLDADRVRIETLEAANKEMQDQIRLLQKPKLGIGSAA